MQRYSFQVRLAGSAQRKGIVGFLSLLVLVLMVAGCASGTAAPAAPAAPAVPTAAAAQPTSVPVTQPSVAPAASEAAAPQVLPAAGATGTAAGGTLVNLASKANFGLYLVDEKGMTLYLYTKDTPNTSNCYDQCAAAWPPLLTNGAPVGGLGVTASLLGTTTRKDGKTQVTYNGNPLYYFVKDQKPGDITGQGVGGVWFVLSPRGSGMTSSKAPGQGTPQAMTVIKPQPTPAGPATLGVSQTDKLGQFVVDDKGMTLYLYTKDTPNTSNCYDQCAVTWPPLLTNGAPVAGTGVDASLLGTTTRKDGTVQVTYKGWPLYHWFRDQKPGDTSGQWVGSVWFVISPKGETITAGKPPATAAPAGAAAPAATAAPTAAPSGGGGYGNAGGDNGYGNAGGNTAPAATAAPAAAGQTVSVDIRNYVFDQKTLTVAAGTTVEWENYDSATHTVTADNGTFDSGNMEQGAKFKFTFTQPGTYAYYCRYHGGPGGQGMAGQIIVK